MSLADDVAWALPEFRAAAESLMVDECRVTRPGEGSPVWNDDTNQYDPPEPSVVYEGPCRVQSRENVVVMEADAGQAQHGLVRLEVHFPVATSGGIERGDRVELLSGTNDPSMVGRVFVVMGPHVGSAKTARRLSVEAVA